jgi:hypothetical protein
MEKSSRSTKWKPGQSGNPRGKKPGTRNRATVLAQALLEKDAANVVAVVVKAALKGDLVAAKLVLERIVPPARERAVNVKLPKLQTAADVDAAMAAILGAVSTGKLMPGEAQTLAAIAEMRRRTIETLDHERRLALVEQRSKELGLT